MELIPPWYVQKAIKNNWWNGFPRIQHHVINISDKRNNHCCSSHAHNNNQLSISCYQTKSQTLFLLAAFTPILSTNQRNQRFSEIKSPNTVLNKYPWYLCSVVIIWYTFSKRMMENTMSVLSNRKKMDLRELNRAILSNITLIAITQHKLFD